MIHRVQQHKRSRPASPPMTSKTIATALWCIRGSESVVSGSGEAGGRGLAVGCVCGWKEKTCVFVEFAEVRVRV